MPSHDSRGDLAAQSLQAVQRLRTGCRDFHALDGKMLAEEVVVHLGLVELLRRQHGREHRHLGAELHVHQRLDHGVGDELVPVDSAVDDEAGGDDRGVAPRLGEDLRVKRNLERARHLEHVDMGEVPRLRLPHEGDAGFLDDVAVPAGLHEGHPLRLGKARMLDCRRVHGNRRLGRLGRFVLGILQHLIHGFPRFKDQNQGTRNDKQPHLAMRLPPTVLFHPDFNRRLRSCTESADPSLRDTPHGRRSRAWAFRPLPPVGTFTPP
ncbi:hypothetical protein ACVL92_002705 [Bradyrhizobium liaoningense]